MSVPLVCTRCTRNPRVPGQRWCGPCRRELPDLEKLHAQFKEKGLTIVGLNDEGRGVARQFSQKYSTRSE